MPHSITVNKIIPASTKQKGIGRFLFDPNQSTAAIAIAEERHSWFVTPEEYAALWAIFAPKVREHSGDETFEPPAYKTKEEMYPTPPEPKNLPPTE